MSALHSYNISTATKNYNGKCQYKTGKCFNERTLKRNGEAHSLCEEHRLKQNMIQRRSDRKYQTIHAIRRRERSQRRAVLKRQVSLAVAQQLFYEHQQQSFAMQLGLPMDENEENLIESDISQVCEGPKTEEAINGMNFDHFVPDNSIDMMSDITDIYPNAERTYEKVANQHDETPTGVDDFTPSSFLSVCIPKEIDPFAEEIDPFSSVIPLLSAIGEKQIWSDEDIGFLQDLLL